MEGLFETSANYCREFYDSHGYVGFENIEEEWQRRQLIRLYQ